MNLDWLKKLVWESENKGAGETEVKTHPLEWPEGWPRTNPAARKKAKFQGTLADAARELEKLVRQQRGKNLVISCIIPQPFPHDIGDFVFGDPGIAISFERPRRKLAFKKQLPTQSSHQEIVLACDKWIRPRDNLKALIGTLKAMEKMDYWGCHEIMERAFDAFEAPALPPPRSCWMILGLSGPVSEQEINAAWRDKAKVVHPDVVGDNGQRMSEVNRARDEALELVGV